MKKLITASLLIMSVLFFYCHSGMSALASTALDDDILSSNQENNEQEMYETNVRDIIIVEDENEEGFVLLGFEQENSTK